MFKNGFYKHNYTCVVLHNGHFQAFDQFPVSCAGVRYPYWGDCTDGVGQGYELSWRRSVGATCTSDQLEGPDGPTHFPRHTFGRWMGESVGRSEGGSGVENGF